MRPVWHVCRWWVCNAVSVACVVLVGVSCGQCGMCIVGGYVR